MKVTVRLGKNGSLIANHNGALLIFDRKHPQPEIGAEVEVMITHFPGYRDNGSVAFLFVRPVTADDLLVQHGGFECSGSMCCTDARLPKDQAALINRVTGRAPTFLTPGRTPIIVADNVNVGWNGQTRVALTPSTAYVAIADIKANLKRICGVPSFNELDPQMLAAVVGYRSVKLAA